MSRKAPTHYRGRNSQGPIDKNHGKKQLAINARDTSGGSASGSVFSDGNGPYGFHMNQMHANKAQPY